MAKGSGYKFVNLQVTALPCTNNQVDMAIRHIKNVLRRKKDNMQDKKMD